MIASIDIAKLFIEPTKPTKPERTRYWWESYPIVQMRLDDILDRTPQQALELFMRAVKEQTQP